jgi:hypothetical protein
MNFGNFFKEEEGDSKKFMMMMNNVHVNMDLLNLNKKQYFKN